MWRWTILAAAKLRAEVPSSLAARTGQLGALVHVTKAFLPSWNAKVNLGRFRLAKDSRALSVKFAARSPSEPAPSVRVDVLDVSDGNAWLGFGSAFNLTREWQTFTAKVAVPERSYGNALDVSMIVGASAGLYLFDEIEVELLEPPPPPPLHTTLAVLDFSEGGDDAALMHPHSLEWEPRRGGESDGRISLTRPLRCPSAAGDASESGGGCARVAVLEAAQPRNRAKLELHPDGGGAGFPVRLNELVVSFWAKRECPADGCPPAPPSPPVAAAECQGWCKSSRSCINQHDKCGGCAFCVAKGAAPPPPPAMGWTPSIYVEALDMDAGFTWLGHWERYAPGTQWTRFEAVTQLATARFGHRVGHNVALSLVVGEVAGKMLIDDVTVRQRCITPSAEAMETARASLDASFEECESSMVVVDNFGGGEMTAEVPSSLAARTGQLGAMVHVTRPFTPSYNAKVRLGRFRLALASTPMSALSVKFAARSPSEPAPSVRVDVLDGTTWLGFARPFNLTREWQTFTARVEVPEKSLGSALDVSMIVGASAGIYLFDDVEVTPLGPPSAPPIASTLYSLGFGKADVDMALLGLHDSSLEEMSRGERDGKVVLSALPSCPSAAGDRSESGGGCARVAIAEASRPAHRGKLDLRAPNSEPGFAIGLDELVVSFWAKRECDGACPPAPPPAPASASVAAGGRTPLHLRRSARCGRRLCVGRVLGAVRSRAAVDAIRGGDADGRQAGGPPGGAGAGGGRGGGQDADRRSHRPPALHHAHGGGDGEAPDGASHGV